MCRLIFVAKRRPDIQSTIRWLCKRLKSPNVKAWRQLVKLMRYIQGTRDMATYFPADEVATKIEAFSDGDWGGDEMDRKSVMGGVIMVAGCRLHTHSRGGQS